MKITAEFVIVVVLSIFMITLIANILGAGDIPSESELLNYTFKEHTNLELHIHTYLEIEILGEKQTIPANVGISVEGMRVIHTHDDSGKIHTESPLVHQFYLTDFFAVWRKRFDNNCILDNCVDENHTLRVYVNGNESNLFGDVPLRDNDRIRIVYAVK